MDSLAGVCKSARLLEFYHFLNSSLSLVLSWHNFYMWDDIGGCDFFLHFRIFQISLCFSDLHYQPRLSTFILSVCLSFSLSFVWENVSLFSISWPPFHSLLCLPVVAGIVCANNPGSFSPYDRPSFHSFVSRKSTKLWLRCHDSFFIYESLTSIWYSGHWGRPIACSTGWRQIGPDCQCQVRLHSLLPWFIWLLCGPYWRALSRACHPCFFQI